MPTAKCPGGDQSRQRGTAPCTRAERTSPGIHSEPVVGGVGDHPAVRLRYGEQRSPAEPEVRASAGHQRRTNLLRDISERAPVKKATYPTNG